MAMINRLLSLVGIVVVGVYLFATSQIPTYESSEPLGPKAFPLGLSILLFVCAISLLVESFRCEPVDEKPVVVTAKERWSDIRLVAGTAGWIALYYFVFESAGFMIATGIFLLGSILYFHRESRTMAILTAVGFSIGTYLLFAKVLEVTLPSGILRIF